ncbi:hypothetical protein [Gilvimarinus sp. 1_MG-2023]|uniref:hypothetical protein n=1 Tax=Gilvimarinus sp. 1_MG-2023 TaxID=3062638 RepID=UPI0026E25B79|nr:hypothetical protein [Gilvimarinus sp. 1_MG-2023]MDO6746788.1 hypothetical protein [Gilvimarinus sp. 1_MG-2023]
MLFQKIKRIVFALTAIVLMLSMVVIGLMNRAVDIDPAPADASMFELTEFALMSQQELNPVINERPVFWSERKPYVEPKPEPKPDPKPVKRKPNTALDGAEILGVMVAQESSSVVLKIGEDVHRIMVEEVYEDWRLADVTENKAVFLLLGGRVPGESTVTEIEFKPRQPLPKTWTGSEQDFSEN